MKSAFLPGRQILSATGLGLACWLLCVGPAPAQETVRQFPSGADGEHTVSWDFLRSDGRNSGVWTNIAVPTSIRDADAWKNESDKSKFSYEKQPR